MTKILVIEDNDDKFERVSVVAKAALPAASLARACDLYEAERAIDEEHWDLLLLDMTLDLKRGGARRVGTAQDYTGGLKIIGQMYYDDRLIPTVIITAFDSFPMSRSDGNGSVVGLESVEIQAQSRLGDLLIGTVRHGPDNWENELRTLLDRFGDTCI
jgi:CheY-like chemotaxis protein